MLIYLDLCCFNRPFDDQTQSRIRLETEAKLVIQQHVRDGRHQLVWRIGMRTDTEIRQEGMKALIQMIKFIYELNYFHQPTFRAKHPTHASYARPNEKRGLSETMLIDLIETGELRMPQLRIFLLRPTVLYWTRIILI